MIYGFRYQEGEGMSVSRIVIDLPDDDLRLLDAIKNIRKITRAEIIRQALDNYLKDNRLSEADGAFGSWRNQKEDGLTFQTTLREEWPS
jgi:hypothetical protein